MLEIYKYFKTGLTGIIDIDKNTLYMNVITLLLIQIHYKINALIAWFLGSFNYGANECII